MTKKQTSKESQVPEVVNPFPGLRPFKIDESHLFFGREGQTDEVLQKLSDHHFVGIIGPSGSGKSSFVYCGVLPILFGGFLTSSGPNWDVIVLRPGSSPIENLAEALLEKDPTYKNDSEEDYEVRKTILTTLLRSNSEGLIEAIKQIKEATNLNYLILVDQFEELFRYKMDIGEKYAVDDTLTFISLLTTASNSKEEAYYVAITMRSDFIGECAQYADLTRKINDSHYLIPQLTRDQKRAAVEGPASVAHGKVTSSLVQRLLNDLGDNPDQLPILQHSLMRTWDFWIRNHEGNAPVDTKHYEAIGTMAEALSLHADEAYNELNDKQKLIAETLFKAITEKRGVFGIRRPTLLKEIAAIAGCKSKDLADIIIIFRKPGRSFLTPAHGVKLTPESMIDISHESLMRIWVRLKNWVDEESEAVGMYLRISEAAEKYQVGKAGLWRPPDLQLGLNWQVKHKPTLVWGQRYNSAFERALSFLEYSKKEYDNEQRVKELQLKRKQRTQRITVGVLSAAVIISLGFLLYANYQTQIAVRNEGIARVQTSKADSSATVATEKSILAERNAQAATDSAEAAQQERAEAQRQAEYARQQADTAQRQREIADQQSIRAQQEQARAEEQELLATNASNEAIKNAEEARLAEENARKGRVIATAKGLGVKAAGNIPDPMLRGLMARQAYNFNAAEEGNPYEADIYSGLYSALSVEGFNDPFTQSLTGHSKEIFAITSSKINDATYTAGTRGRILKWTLNGDSPTSEVIASARGSATAEIEDIAVSSDGTHLVVAGVFASNPDPAQTYLEVYNLSNSNSKTQIGGIEKEASSIAILPDNRTLIYLDQEGKRLNKVNINSTNKSALYTSVSKISEISLNPAGDRVAGVTDDGKLLIFDLNGTVVEEKEFIGSLEYVAVKYSGDGAYLAIGDAKGIIHLLNSSNLSVIKRFTDQVGSVEEIDFNLVNDKSTFMVTGSLDRSVRIYNLQSVNDPPITYHTDFKGFSVAFSPNGEFVYAGSERSVLKLFTVEAKIMADKICPYLDRPAMTNVEWEAYVGNDIPKENTCDNVSSASSDQ